MTIDASFVGYLNQSLKHWMYVTPSNQLVWIPFHGIGRGHIIQDSGDLRQVERRVRLHSQLDAFWSIGIIMLAIPIYGSITSIPQMAPLLILAWTIYVGLKLYLSLHPCTASKTKEILISTRALSNYIPLGRRLAWWEQTLFWVFIASVLVAVFISPVFRIPILIFSPLLIIDLHDILKPQLTAKARSKTIQ